MEKIKIGYDAGKIWKQLKENGTTKITDLMHWSKMDFKDIYLALGWLARENKLAFLEKEHEAAVCVVD